MEIVQLIVDCVEINDIGTLGIFGLIFYSYYVKLLTKFNYVWEQKTDFKKTKTKSFPRITSSDPDLVEMRPS